MTTITADIFFDFGCPYVYRAALWLEAVQAEMGPRLVLRWRPFALAQVNNKVEGWALWEQPARDPAWGAQRSGRGLRAFWGWLAAQQVAPAQADGYRLALLRAIHEERLSLDDESATRAAAERVGLDLAAWARAAADQRLLATLQAEHEAGQAAQIFGTPTFVFPAARPAYLKLDALVPAAEALAYWRDFHRAVVERPLFLEIKRPH